MAGFTGEMDTKETFPGVDPHPRTSGQSSRLSLPTSSAEPGQSDGARTPPSSGVTPSPPKKSSSEGNSTPEKPNVPPDALDDFVILVEQDGR